MVTLTLIMIKLLSTDCTDLKTPLTDTKFFGGFSFFFQGVNEEASQIEIVNEPRVKSEFKCISIISIKEKCQ